MMMELMSRGRWWARWICERVALEHEWVATGHPRLYECFRCGAIGLSRKSHW